MHVGQFADGMSQGIVDLAGGPIAAMHVRHNAAAKFARHRPGKRLGPVADYQHHLAAQMRRDAAMPRIAPPAPTPRSPAAHGATASMGQPSRRISSTDRPCRRSRCIPVATICSVSFGCLTMAFNVDCISPNSAREPVMKQMRRRSLLLRAHLVFVGCPCPAHRLITPLRSAGPRRTSARRQSPGRPGARPGSASPTPGFPFPAAEPPGHPVEDPPRRHVAVGHEALAADIRTSFSLSSTRLPPLPRICSASRTKSTYAANSVGSNCRVVGPRGKSVVGQMLFEIVAPAATANVPDISSVV